MASNIPSAAVPSTRRNGKRLMFGLLAAALLVTLPVVPLHLVSGADFNRLLKLGESLFSRGDPQAQPVDAPVGAVKEKTVSVDEVGLVEHAESQLLAKLQKQPDEPALYNQLGLLYAGAGEYDKAAGYLLRAIDVAHMRISQVMELEAQSRAHGLVAQASQAVLDRSRIGVELSAAHSSLARVYDQLGQHDKVAAQLDQLNRDIAFGSSLSVRQPISTATIGAASAANHQLSQPVLKSLARAEAYMQEHRVQEAIAEFKRVIQMDPLAPLAHERLGKIALETDNNYLAVQELEIATRLDPNDASVHNGLGTAYQQKGENDRAVEEYEKALSLNGNLEDAAYNLGNLLCQIGHPKQAEEAFARLTKMKPDSAMAHNNLGTVMSLNGDYKDAIDEFEHALSLDPQLASSHYGLGVALYNANSYPASIRELKKALALNPALTDAQVKLQSAYKKTGSSNGFMLN